MRERGAPGYSGAFLTLDPREDGATIHAERGVTVIGVVRDGETRLPVAGANVHADSGQTVGTFEVPIEFLEVSLEN